MQMSPERWEEISPEMAHYMRIDGMFIDIVSQMIAADDNELLDNLITQARFVLTRMHDFPITEDFLRDQIDDTVNLITNPERYYADAAHALDDVLTQIILEPKSGNVEVA